MNYDEVMATIAASNKDDWVKDGREHNWTYKGNLSIRLVDTTEEGLGAREFNEPWAQGVGSEPPRRINFTIYYGNSFVRDVALVDVDGGRAYLPTPKSADELRITRWQYRFARIVQPPFDQLDSYLERARLRREG